MPQYKRTQYGLKQYGTFIPIQEPESSSRYQFVKARFGVKKKDGIFWLYQHRAVTVPGRPRRLRLRTNQGEHIQEDQVTLNGHYTRLRIRTNKDAYTYSETIEK